MFSNSEMVFREPCKHILLQLCRGYMRSVKISIIILFIEFIILLYVIKIM